MNELIELAEECLNEAKALLNLYFVKGAIN